MRNLGASVDTRLEANMCYRYLCPPKTTLIGPSESLSIQRKFISALFRQNRLF
jgi:hypothetical protein